MRSEQSTVPASLSRLAGPVRPIAPAAGHSRHPGRTADAVRLPDGLFASYLPIERGAAWVEGWRALNARALVPNLFFDPCFALAAQPAFGDAVHALVISDRPPNEAGARCLAVWPCRIARRRWGVPLPLLMGWTHRFCLLGAPLLDRARAGDVMAALLRAPGRLGLPGRLMFTYAPQDGPFAECLSATLGSLGLRSARYWAHHRAGMVSSGPGYLAHLSSRRRRKLGQLLRRLEAGGPILFETIRDRSALAAAVQDYVALESAGWKGREGTAIGCVPEEVTFILAAVTAMGEEDRVRIDRFTRGGRTLAASIAFETDRTLWYLKISFDEAEARNSPGALLVQRVTQSILDEGRITQGDSCAPPGYPLMETFWKERLPIANVLVEAEGGDPFYRPAAWLEGARERAIRAVLARRARRADAPGPAAGQAGEAASDA